jgi:membrane protease YdiL (CAAX protease family)
VLLFLIWTTLALTALGTISSLLLREDLGSSMLAVLIPHGLLCLALLAASYVMMRWAERKPFVALGLLPGREGLVEAGKGALIGGGFIAVLVVAQTLLGWLRPAPDAGTLLGWLGQFFVLGIVLTIAAAAEELMLRGYPFQVLVEGAGVIVGVILTSGLFAMIHLNNPEVDWVALLNIGLAGVLFAAAYLRTRSLWVPIGMHWGWNFAMGAFFDLPVSGIVFDMPGYDTVELGPDLFTGGGFGPEGGLLATLFVLPLIVWVSRTRWLSESPRMAELEPLVDSRAPRD